MNLSLFDKKRFWTSDFLKGLCGALAFHSILFFCIRISPSPYPHDPYPLPFTQVEAVVTPIKKAPLKHMAEIPNPFQKPYDPSCALKRGSTHWEYIVSP